MGIVVRRSSQFAENLPSVGLSLTAPVPDRSWEHGEYRGPRVIPIVDTETWCRCGMCMGGSGRALGHILVQNMNMGGPLGKEISGWRRQYWV